MSKKSNYLYYKSKWLFGSQFDDGDLVKMRYDFDVKRHEVKGGKITKTFNSGEIITICGLAFKDYNQWFVVQKGTEILIPVGFITKMSKSRSNSNSHVRSTTESKKTGEKKRYVFALRTKDEEFIAYKGGELLSLVDDSPKHFKGDLYDDGKFSIKEPWVDLLSSLIDENFEDGTMSEILQTQLEEKIVEKFSDKERDDIFPLIITLDFPDKRNNIIKKGKPFYKINKNGTKNKC